LWARLIVALCLLFKITSECKGNPDGEIAMRHFSKRPIPRRYAIAAFIITASIYVATLLILDYFQIPYNLYVIIVIVSSLVVFVVYGIVAHHTEH